jgi:hypothetical protein
MDATLFLGHGKTEIRGGPGIFMSMYSKWPDSNKFIIYEKSYIQAIRKLASFIKNNKISMLILENEYFTEVLLAFVLKLINRKIKIYGPAYHMPSPPKAGRGFLNSLIHYLDYKMGLLLMAHIYSGIYTENSYMRDYIISLNPGQHVIVESPGIKNEYIPPESMVMNAKKDIDFLFLTSMTKNKGIYDFLALSMELQKIYKGIKIFIAGYASDEVLDYINNLMSSGRLDNIEIKHNISDDEKYELFLRSKIYVLPSIEDGIPITFYEAWAYGNTVIAYNLETYSDITGYFVGVEKSDIRGLIQACELVYNNYNTYFGELFRKSYRYSINHSYEKEIDEIIKNILDSNLIN